LEGKPPAQDDPFPPEKTHPIPQVQYQEIVAPGVESLKGPPLEKRQKIPVEEAVLTHGIDADPGQWGSRKGDAIPASEQFRVVHALQAIVDQKPSILTRGKAGIPEERGRGDPDRDEHHVSLETPAVFQPDYSAGDRFHGNPFDRFDPPPGERLPRPLARLLGEIAKHGRPGHERDPPDPARIPSKMPQICGDFDGRGASAHHNDANPLPDARTLYLSSGGKEVLDRFDGKNVLAGGMEESQRDLAPRVEGDGIVPDLGSRSENQGAPHGIHLDHAVLDERCPPVLRHLLHVEPGLGGPVYSREQAGPHSGIVVIRGRADQRNPVTGPHGVTQARQRRQVGVASSNENQVLRHLPLSCIEAFGVRDILPRCYDIPKI